MYLTEKCSKALALNIIIVVPTSLVFCSDF